MNAHQKRREPLAGGSTARCDATWKHEITAVPNAAQARLFVVVVVRRWNRSREWRRYADESAARGIVARLRWHGFDAAMERAT